MTLIKKKNLIGSVLFVYTTDEYKMIQYSDLSYFLEENTSNKERLI